MLILYLTLTTIIGALLMFKLTFIKSKFFLVVVGVLVSVVFYYINYFSILFGKNETLPVLISVWLPQVIMFLILLAASGCPIAREPPHKFKPPSSNPPFINPSFGSLR